MSPVHSRCVQDAIDDRDSHSRADLIRYVFVNPEHQRAVDKAIKFMTANLGDEVTVDRIAQVMRYSKFHASRIFIKITGVTPGRYLANLRREEAARMLLRFPKMKVTDIAHSVGYTSVGTFSTMFTAYHGVPPTLYRVSRCGCGLFDGTPHGLSQYCGYVAMHFAGRTLRAALKHERADLEKCGKCHTCLVDHELQTPTQDMEQRREQLLGMEKPVS